MSFHVGQKVVCVDALHTDITGKIELIEGAIYTVRFFGRASCWNNPKYTGIRVREIPVRHHANGVAHDIAFDATRFRPVIERKTDIAIFTAMLDPSRVGDRENVSAGSE